MPESKHRVSYFDVAKGIGILSIILGHMEDPSINRVVFTCHVPLFYFISGYFLNKKTAFSQFVLQKAKRLLLPYAYACAAVIAGSLIFSSFFGSDPADEFFQWLFAAIYGAGDSYEQPFHVRGIGAIWFLPALFWGLIAARYCIEKPAKRIIPTIGIIYLCIFSARYIWLPFSIQAGGTAALYILIGYAAGKTGVLDHKTNPFYVLISLAAWICAIFSFQGFWLVHNYFGNGMLDFLGSICGIYLVLLLSRVIEKRLCLLKKVLEFYGRNSLTVLCVHLFELNVLPMRTVMNRLWNKIGDTPALLCTILIKLVFITGVTFLLEYIKQKIRKPSGEEANELS